MFGLSTDSILKAVCEVFGMYYIGIDLGTSAVKLLLLDEGGKIHHQVSKEYPLVFPKTGWSEQDPQDWKTAVFGGIKELIRNVDPTLIRGLGVGGQMHGLVVLDKEDRVLRPAILWNDGRTGKQVEYLNRDIGKGKLSALTANIAFAGFTAPKLLWMRENEPELFDRIKKVMLPKDYINYLLTGVHCTDYSDASGMLLLDVKNRCWSQEMLEICGLTEEQMPALYESFEPVGKILPEVAECLGLSPEVIVAAGAGDNAAAAVGTGTIGKGGCNLSLGTSGTIFISSDQFKADEYNALHAFAHADGGYHLMGCMLSAASCNKWLLEDILGTEDYAGEQEKISEDRLGENDVYFLPYLMGERSPINDVDARGTFIGMTMGTGRADLVQAVLEGVAFAIRDSLEVARHLGIAISHSRICGGGAKSRLWKRIMANVLNVELETVVSEQGPGLGAAMLSMVACGDCPDVKEVCEKLVEVKERIKPEPKLAEKYDKKYQRFKMIYPACRELFAVLAADE